MKKCDSTNANATSVRASNARRDAVASPTLDAILRLAYRRHARGRLAIEAVNACLGP